MRAAICSEIGIPGSCFALFLGLLTQGGFKEFPIWPIRNSVMGPTSISPVGGAPAQRTTVRLRWKLARFSLVTAGLSGLLVCGVLLLFESYSVKRDLADRLSDLADLGAATAQSSLESHNTAAATAILGNFIHTPQVLAAGIYDANGRLFAMYSRPQGPGRLPLMAPEPGVTSDMQAILVVRTISPSGRVLGRICLAGDLSGITAEVIRNLSDTALALFVCLGASMFVLNRFLRATTEPILALTRTARTVSQSKTYSLRALKGPDDEVGELVTAFNEMLGEIEARDTELEHHRSRLKDLVAERTSELVAARDKAQEGERLKSQFLANMSHEIRTPLNGVLGLTNILLETKLDSQQKDLLDTVKTSAESLMTVINDILDLSKIEAGRMNMEAVRFSPRAVAGAAVKTVDWSARQKGIRIVQKFAEDVPESVVGDPVRVKQVLLNLLGNAVKFTKRGQITVELSLREGMLLFGVRDTGIGIARANLQTIFEPFRQADGSTTRQYGGTGLGLSISSKLVALMGGTMKVESDLGVGSYFGFTLPLIRIPDTPPAALPVPGAAEEPTESFQILLAEDNVVNQRVATRLLEKRGHRVLVASNGEEAVEIWKRNDIDLVLMDVQMPRMSGYEATAAIRDLERQNGRSTPIVAVTAHAISGDREKCLDSGMDEYVTKPIRMEELTAAIRRALELRPRVSV